MSLVGTIIWGIMAIAWIILWILNRHRKCEVCGKTRFFVKIVSPHWRKYRVCRDCYKTWKIIVDTEDKKRELRIAEVRKQELLEMRKKIAQSLSKVKK